MTTEWLKTFRPDIAEFERLANSPDPYETGLAELWRGTYEVSSVTAARLRREQADAILVRLCARDQ